MLTYLDAFRGKKTLITGGLGFIGSNLAHRLVELGADVLIVDSLIPGYGGNLFNVADIRDRVHVNIADVRDRSSMDYLVQGQDYLFNLAGQVSHLDSMVDPFTDLEINCRSQLSILESCRYNNPEVKVVFASTRQIYGVPDYLPVDERHLVHPTDVNGINKMAGEWYHIVYNNVYGVRAASLRLTNTYGPRMRVVDARRPSWGSGCAWSSRASNCRSMATGARCAISTTWTMWSMPFCASPQVPSPTDRCTTWAAMSRSISCTWPNSWSSSLDGAATN
jgi:UDP-glucose 4-epimerase